MNNRRFKFYKQLESTDCAFACIRMIAFSFGIHIDYSCLNNMLQSTKEGITLRQIVSICKNIGLEAKPIYLRDSSLKTCPLPAIFHCQDNHYVIVHDYDKRNNIVYMADPAIGKYKMPIDEFSLYWKRNNETGIVILVGSSDNNPINNKIPNKDWGVRGFLRYIVQEINNSKAHLTTILVLSSICLLLDLIFPYLFQQTIDSGIGKRDINIIWSFIIAQFCVFIGSFISTHLSNYISTKLSIKLDLQLTGRYLSKLLLLPITFFDIRSGSDLIQKIGDQSRIRNFLLSIPQTLIFTLLNIIIFSIMLLYYSTPIFLIFSLFTTFGIIWNLQFLEKRKTIDASHFSESSYNRNLIYEIINGIVELKCNSAEVIKLKSWKTSQERLNSLTLKTTRLGITISGGSDILIRIRDLLITGIAASLVVKGSLTIGGMMTISYIVGRLSTPFSTLLTSINSIQDASLSYDRLTEVIHHDLPTSDNHDILSPSIDLKDVWFHYPGYEDKFVLKNITINIQKGETIAIVGESGCGKSTLLKLFLGFYCPQKGKILLGGKNIHEITHSQWIKKCGVVLQTGFIFSDTILANVTMINDCDAIDTERFWDTLEIAGIKGFVMNQPMKERTIIGATGKEISGGQRQRLMIARALYSNPEILIMDEATSSLDANNEALIVDRLKDRKDGRTVIISAHRLSTVRHADRIIYLREGEILEQGTHEELMRLQGKYFELVNRQIN